MIVESILSTLEYFNSAVDTWEDRTSLSLNICFADYQLEKKETLKPSNTNFKKMQKQIPGMPAFTQTQEKVSTKEI